MLLVIENDPRDPLSLFHEWLNTPVHIVRTHKGEQLPSLDDYTGLIVLGGPQDSFDAPDGEPSADWIPPLRTLIRESVTNQVPFLGICLGGQLLAVACGGLVTRSRTGPEYGLRPLTLTRAAAYDVLFENVPEHAPAVQWHNDEIVSLPPGSVLLASTQQIPHQAFRLGKYSWGVQFHPEFSDERIMLCGERAVERLPSVFPTSESLTQPALAAREEMSKIWRGVAERFTEVVRHQSR